MRILVIEDEHKIANSIKVGLEQEGFSVDVAYNGIKGYDLASTETYDLIVLDLMLPGMDGIKICTKLRANDNHVAILMLTAKGDIDDKVLGLTMGADDYLAKPFAFNELVARVRALLRRPSVFVPSVLTCGDIEVNVDNFEVKVKGKLINLSRKEFSLLEYFMRNPNKILTKQRLIEHVWSYDSDILPNSVEVYMGYLRNKLERPFSKDGKIFKTIRGYGYKLICGEEDDTNV